MTEMTVAQFLSGSTLGLSTGLNDLLRLQIGDRSMLYGLSPAERRLVAIRADDDGAMQLIDTLELHGAFSSGDSPSLGHMSDADGQVWLTLSGLSQSDGQVVSLTSDGALGLQQSLPVGQLHAPVAINIGGTPGLLSGRQDGGLNFFVDTGTGLGWQDWLSDTDNRNLADVAAGVSFQQNDTTYAATLSNSENGLNVVAITATNITQVAALGSIDGFPLDQPSDLATIQRLSETLLIVSSSQTGSVSVFGMTAGDLHLADHIQDAQDTRFAGAATLDALSYGDFAFAAVGGTEGGVTLLTVLPGGRLIHLASLADDETTPLAQLSTVSLQVSNSDLMIFATSAKQAGITQLDYSLSGLGRVVLADGTGSDVNGTPADDQLIGSDIAERINGGAGDDILLDGAGSDVLVGEEGADLFALAADGQPDTIADFERGIDRLDLSSFDFLYDIQDLTISPTQTGAVLTHGDETIIVHTSDGQPLTPGDLATADILNVDRQPLHSLGQELVGGGAPDTLNGGMGADTILGAGGGDHLTGSFGDDSLEGGAGLDLLLGEDGFDTLRGQGESDTLVGGGGNDVVFGGGGGDLIYGDDWPGL